MIRLRLLLILLTFLAGCSEKEQKPNIIIFFTDDQGYADVGTYGAKGFDTPHLDNLASEGLRLTNFYVPATVCTPSRAGLLTGRYPVRSNMHEAVLFPYSDTGLDSAEITLAELLKTSGYSTSIVGKWHLGHKPEYMPNSQGFDYFFGVPYSNDMDSYYYEHNEFQSPPLPLYRNEELIESGPDQRYLTKRYTEEVVKLIRNRSENPFFIYMAHNMPHVPLHVSPDFQDKSELGIYGDVIMELDWSVGEIVKALKEEEIYQNTIFIFTSDNGPDRGSALPLRGRKAQTWEGGQRVPCIITWPEKISANQSSEEILNSMDFFPTLARIAGVELPSDLIIDGTDVSSHWVNPLTDVPVEKPFFYFARNGKIEAVRQGDWKLHIAKTIGWNESDSGAFPLSLYNLREDISEQVNLSEKYPDKVKELQDIIADFESSLAGSIN